MIRVLHYIGRFGYGGSQTIIMNIYRNIDRTKIQFDFVVHIEDKTSLYYEAEKLGAKFYVCPHFTTKTAGIYIKWWNEFLKEHSEYNIVHSHIRSTAAIVLGIAKKYGYKTIAHSHNTSSGKGISASVKNIFQYPIRFIADYFMGCSQMAGEWLFGERVCSSSKYFNLKNAIEIDNYSFNELKAREVKEEFGYDESDIVIGHIGRFTDQKNHSFLLEVFNELHKNNPKYKLLLVGEGELRADIEKKIVDFGIEDAVTLTGVRRDVPRLLMGMDIFLFPSKWEGLPLSVIEAQAAGLQCVISSSISREVIITDLVTCVNLESGVQTWIKKIEKITDIKHKNESDKIVQSGYDIKTSVQWLSEFYKEIV